MIDGVDIPCGSLLADGDAEAHLLLYHGAVIHEGRQVPTSQRKSQGTSNRLPSLLLQRVGETSGSSGSHCYTSPSSRVLCSPTSLVAQKGAPSLQLAGECKASTHFHQPPLQCKR